MTGARGEAQWKVAEWHGKMLVDRNGEKIGELQDVYVDVDEPQCATVKQGFIGRHLTFVPVGGIQIYPDGLPVGHQGAGSVGAAHRGARRGALAGRRINALSPLRAELQTDRRGKRPPVCPPLKG
jgi:PRC-barrel domain